MNESANTNAQVRFFSKKISFGEKLCIKGQGKRVILPHFFTWPPAKFDHKLHVLISLSVWHACHFYASYLPTRKLENQGRHKKSLLHKEYSRARKCFTFWKFLTFGDVFYRPRQVNLNLIREPSYACVYICPSVLLKDNFKTLFLKANI